MRLNQIALLPKFYQVAPAGFESEPQQPQPQRVDASATSVRSVSSTVSTTRAAYPASRTVAISEAASTNAGRCSTNASFVRRLTLTCTTPVRPSKTLVTCRTQAPHDMPETASVVVRTSGLVLSSCFIHR